MISKTVLRNNIARANSRITALEKRRRTSLKSKKIAQKKIKSQNENLYSSETEVETVAFETSTDITDPENKGTN